MLPKKNRISKKDVDFLFKNGKFVRVGDLSLRFFLDKTRFPPKVAFIAPKTITKKATLRNLLKRRARAVARKYVDSLPHGFSGVFLFRKYLDDSKIIENEIRKIISRIN